MQWTTIPSFYNSSAFKQLNIESVSKFKRLLIWAQQIMSMPSIYNTAKNVTVLIIAFVLVILINITYMLYHLYMKKKAEFSNRLLNVLYSQFAIFGQLGSFIVLLMIFYSLGLIGSEKVQVLLMFRQVQLLMMSYYCITISVSNMLHTFKMSLYLHLSCNRHGYIYVFVTVLMAR